ncbi:MAG TPA: thiamine pyrophosphate-binding protein [Solirubrobacterales bacterium]|nr:thiamine pyrophosphate-binding protein [Solirubrobacterales bacterium]
MKAARYLIELAQSEGVDRVFGNPGTTELPLMDELAKLPEVPYFLGLHEGTAVSMADGFARATGRPSFVNLHIAAGLAHGLANVLNAKRARTPMVVTVGQQDRRHLIRDPMLGGDLVGLAQGAFKYAVEVNQAADLPTLMRRAFLLSQTSPTGPVMVSVPLDVLEEELDEPMPPRTEVRGLGVAEGVEDLAEALLGAGAPAIVAGDGVGREGAVGDLVELAESVGATVFHEPMYDCVDFPATHPLSAGMLPPVDQLIRDKLAKHDVVFLVGSHAFSAHYYTEAGPIPERTQVLQLDSDRAELGRNYPAAIALHGGIGPTVRALTRMTAGRCPEAEARIAAARSEQGERSRPTSPPRSDSERMDPAAAAEALVAGLPEDTIMLEEAITTGLEVRRVFAADRPGSYHHSVGGALGWALGAGIGVKMARPEDPVVSVVGDGTAMYTIQGLWSAAHYDVPLVLVVMNNREYAACKRGVARVVSGGGERYVGMDLTDPEIDFIGLSRSLGVDARSAATTDELTSAVSDALASGAPSLIDAAVAGTREAASGQPAEHHAADR